MIKFEHTEVLGWKAAIRGMRNPMNSWEKSDTKFYDESPEYRYEDCPDVGPNDHDLMMRLAKGGPVHAKYRRMIAVYVNITAPLYWWKEFDTYKVGTVANSCSTMHKIAAKEFTLEDFSCEHLSTVSWTILNSTIQHLNWCREVYLKNKDKGTWWQMIQLLPSSYNQKRTVMLNYEVLAGIYPSRKDHKLDEWHVFCDWIKSLPYSEIIIGKPEEKKDLKDIPIANEIMEEAKRRILEETEKRFYCFQDQCKSVFLEKKLNVPDDILRGKRAKITVIDEFADIPKENRPTACDLCKSHDCGDSDEEVCKKCKFYKYSKWMKDQVAEAMAEHIYAPAINKILDDVEKSQAEESREIGEALLEGMKKGIDPAERNNDVSKAMKDIMDKLNADGATTEDISKDLEITHLVDVTCSWQVEELGGRRLYMLAPGCTRDELTPYERTLLDWSEEYKRDRQEKERKNRKKKKNKRKK